jgi:tRNA dimethylallyltransferase
VLKTLPKLITILGPTASGKSSLGIELAKKHNGEIISADSRQVFRKLDIGTGKVDKEEQKEIKHHLIDILDPEEEFSVADFQKIAFSAIDDIISRKKMPFLVGGTALYIYSVIDNYKITDVVPDKNLRDELSKKTLQELQKMISKNILNVDDYKNPRRLIRTIEKLNQGVAIEPQKGPQKYDNIILGININREELYKKIDKRVDERIKQGMIEEVENLRKQGINEEWLINLGLEYKWITEYLQGKLGKKEMIEKLKFAIHAFARRQMTWFRKDGRIRWVDNIESVEEIIID